MLVSEVKIIDKRYSQWDEKKSDPKKGKYAWIKKEYVKPHGKYDKNKEWKLWWAPYDVENNLKKFTAHMARLQFEPVTLDDPFVPDGAILNADHYWVFGDLVLVKFKLLDYLLRRDKEIKLSKLGGASELKSFHEEMRREGAALPDAMIEEYLGKEVDPEEIKKRTLKPLY